MSVVAIARGGSSAAKAAKVGKGLSSLKTAGLGMAGNALGNAIAKKKKKTGGAIGGAASGAATGASIGSIIPGVGTAVGGVVGGLVGGIKGWFGGKKKLKEEKKLSDMAKKKKGAIEAIGKPSDYMKEPPKYSHSDPRKGN